MMPTVSRQQRPGGYMRTFDAFGRVVEADTFTCAHCSAVIEVEPRGAPNFDLCYGCMARVCTRCAVTMREKGCTPWLKRVERAELLDRDRVRFLRDCGLLDDMIAREQREAAERRERERAPGPFD